MSSRLRFSLSRNVLAVLVVGLGVALFACGESPAKVKPATRTPDPIGIEFDKQSVTIEGVTEGQDVTQPFLLINRGEQAAIVKNVSVVDASECDHVVVPESSFFVPPGEVSVMSVLMNGHKPSASPHTVLVGVQTQQGGDIRTELAITFREVIAAPGVQSGPRLGVDHLSVNIGTIPYNWPMHERFEIYNYGDQPLQLDGAPLIRILEGC